MRTRPRQSYNRAASVVKGSDNWREGFRAPRSTLPTWAEDEPTRLIYQSNEDGKWETYAWDLTTQTRRQVTNRSNGTPLSAIDPKGDWIWWFDDSDGNEFGRWMMTPFLEGRSRQAILGLPPGYSAGLAIGRRWTVVGISAGPVEIFITRQGKRARFICELEDGYVGSISADDALCCIEHSKHGDSRHPSLLIFSCERGEVVTDLSDGPGAGLWSGEWSPIKGDLRLIVHHEQEGQLRPSIWSQTRGYVDLPISLPGEIDASWYPAANALLLSHDCRGRTELYTLDLTTNRLSRIPTPVGTISAAQVRPDKQVWFDWSDSVTPSQVRTNGAVLISRQKAPSFGSRYEDFEVDGIHGFLARPQGIASPPAMFLIHGGPDQNWSDSYWPRVQAWVEHGFTAVLVNYRGSTGYGRAWRDAARDNPGFTELTDLAKARQWLVENSTVDPTRIGLAGGSWGGFLTLLALGIQPELWSLGIAISPIADYLDAYDQEMEQMRAMDRALFGGTPAEIPEVYRIRSPIRYASRVRAPVMVIAGRNDRRCPLRQVENYVRRLRDLGKPVCFLTYKLGHSYLPVELNIRQLDEQIAFAERHLRRRPRIRGTHVSQRTPG